MSRPRLVASSCRVAQLDRHPSRSSPVRACISAGGARGIE
jgi:hypothetical protein